MSLKSYDHTLHNTWLMARNVMTSSVITLCLKLKSSVKSDLKQSYDTCNQKSESYARGHMKFIKFAEGSFNKFHMK